MIDYRYVEMQLNNYSKFIFGDCNRNPKNLLSSDQFFSSLVNIDQLIYQDDNIKMYMDARISSLMLGVEVLYNNSITKVRFLRKPLIPVYIKDSNLTDLFYKNFKSIEFISMEAFKYLRNFYNYNLKCFELNKKDLLELEFISSNYIIHIKESAIGIDSRILDKVISIKSDIHAQIPRSHDEGNSRPFTIKYLNLEYFEKENFYVKPFFYFITDIKDNTRLNSVLDSISFFGIGGKKNIGFGLCSNVVNKSIQSVDCMLEVFEKKNSIHYLTISSLLPSVDDDLNKIEYYKLEKRNGYIYDSAGDRGMQKPDIHVITEGALILEDLIGSVIKVPLKDDLGHDVLMYGKSLSIPL